MTRAAVLMALVLLVSTHAQAQQWAWPERSENLQVLPSDFPPDRLRAVMTGFTRALGVRCSFCHVGEEGQPLTTYDFPSDDNPRKNTARTMLRMLGVINDTLSTIETSGARRVNMWCHTCHRGRPRPLTLEEELREVYEAEGLDATTARYRDLLSRFQVRGAYDFGEGSLNSLGYALLEEHPQDAIVIFQLNAEQFPQSGNVWDSLAEGYLTVGDRARAVEFYEKSLALDPENDNAREKLRELGQDD